MIAAFPLWFDFYEGQNLNKEISTAQLAFYLRRYERLP
jgi:hypothetical protein